MPLTDTGKQSNTQTGITILTKNEKNENVIVTTTMEANQDFGKGVIVSVASAKYDKQDVIPNTNPVQISVTTTDCANMVGRGR
jgi:hypothetical protein